MKSENLPFEITPQIKRYLKEISNFNDEFFASDLGKEYILEAYLDNEKPSYKLEESNQNFWEYLQSKGVIKIIGKPEAKLVFYTDINENIMVPFRFKFKILSSEFIKEILEEIENNEIKPINKEKNSIIKVEFDDSRASILINDHVCKMPPFRNEHFFCRAMFEHPIGIPVSWDECYEKITGYYKNYFGKTKNTEENWHKVYDTMRALNERVKDTTNVNEDLFVWQQRTIKRIK